ncbi:hypothetical protein PENSPDRAFT_442258 [Peniophora sp. CONT]|nr:hypothetical protein PENSPDRAFT_442258 [Peniophora sp. CONT]
MIGARSRLPRDFRWLLQAPETLSTVVQNEDDQRQLALHVEDASTTSPNAVDSPEAAVSDITRSPNRGVGFDLEQVVIDTAIGRVSLPLSGQGAIASGPRASISASFDDGPNYPYEDNSEVLPTQSSNTEEGDQPNAQASAPGSLELGSRSSDVLDAHPQREDAVAGEPEHSASISEVTNAERLASDPMERHGEGSAPGADRDFAIPQSNAGREQGQGFESGNSELVHN